MAQHRGWLISTSSTCIRRALTVKFLDEPHRRQNQELAQKTLLPKRHKQRSAPKKQPDKRFKHGSQTYKSAATYKSHMDIQSAWRDKALHVQEWQLNLLTGRVEQEVTSQAKHLHDSAFVHPFEKSRAPGWRVEHLYNFVSEDWYIIFQMWVLARHFRKSYSKVSS